MKLLRTALILSLAGGLDRMLRPVEDSAELADHPERSRHAVRSYLGTWIGPAVTSFPTAQSCGESAVEDHVADRHADQREIFKRPARAAIHLAGTMVATHSDTPIPWAASGTATQANDVVSVQS